MSKSKMLSWKTRGWIIASLLCFLGWLINGLPFETLDRNFSAFSEYLAGSIFFGLMFLCVLGLIVARRSEAKKQKKHDAQARIERDVT